MVFVAFRRRLYREWFLFLNDLSVATGRPPCLPPGLSGAEDVVETLQEKLYRAAESEAAAEALVLAGTAELTAALDVLRKLRIPLSGLRRHVAPDLVQDRGPGLSPRSGEALQGPPQPTYSS